MILLKVQPKTYPKIFKAFEYIMELCPVQILGQATYYSVHHSTFELVTRRFVKQRVVSDNRSVEQIIKDHLAVMKKDYQIIRELDNYRFYEVER